MRFTYLTIVSVLIMMSLCFAPLSLGSENSSTTHSESIAYQADNASHEQSLLSNLQTAYFAEVVESELYQAFSTKADDEGYKGLASLFRALSKAENIHSTRRATLIHLYGGTPLRPSEPVIVGTTIENLDWAIEAETYEQGFMYPDYFYEVALSASADNGRELMVAQYYEFCLRAETAHLRLLQAAQSNVEVYKEHSIDFLICPRCASVTQSQDVALCMMCAVQKKDFIQIR